MSWFFVYWILSFIGVLGFVLFDYYDRVRINLFEVVFVLVISPFTFPIFLFVFLNEFLPEKWYIIQRKNK